MRVAWAWNHHPSRRRVAVSAVHCRFPTRTSTCTTTRLLCYYAAATATTVNLSQRNSSSGSAMAWASSSGSGACTNGPLAQLVSQPQRDTAAAATAAASSLPSHPMVQLHHFTEPVGSTQDVARQIVLDNAKNANHSDDNKQKDQSMVVVIADQQVAGRGTHGRNWESGASPGTGTMQQGDGGSNNLYMTVGVAQSKIPVLLTLLPLQIAVLVADRVNFVLQHYCTTGKNDATTATPTVVHVKWPNDVLVNDAKLAGTLIESVTVEHHVKDNNDNTKTLYESWFLIGIGVNLSQAPSLTQSPGKQIRPAIALQDVCANDQNFPPSMALYFGADIAYGLADWIHTGEAQAMANQKVVEAWKTMANFGSVYEIRSDNVQDEETGTYIGEKVIAVDVQADGQLQVRDQDGKERLLVSDYFF